MAEEIRTEVASGDNQSLQSDQSGQVSQNGGMGEQQQAQGQPAEQQSQPEPFLGVTDVNAIPAEMKPLYKQWEAAYTQKTQKDAERNRQIEAQAQQVQLDNQLFQQKAEQLDVLTANPEFQQWIVERSQQQGQQASDYQMQMDLDQFEDGPGLKSLLSEMGNMVRHEMQPFRDEMAQIRSGFSTQRADSDFNLLVQQAKTNGWTDPNVLKKNIDFMRSKNPNMSLPDAYSIAESQYRRSGLLNLKPVAGQQASSSGTQGTGTGIPIQGDKGTVTNPPGGTAVQGRVGEVKSSLERALTLQKEGKTRPGGRVDIKPIFDGVINDMIASGQSIDPRDL